MEEQSLTEYLVSHSAPTGEHASACAAQPWYNHYGDCIEYQTEQVAIVADRIDNYLTIYLAADTRNPVGFQLKDVKALMKLYQSNYGVIWTAKDQKLTSVTALLFAAIESQMPLTIKKRQGYQQAVQTMAKNDGVALVGN